MHKKELYDRIEKSVSLSQWDKEIYEKTGYIRWESVLHFFSIDAVKSGYLHKKKGVWYFTPEGEEALKLGEIGFFNACREGYKKWRVKNIKDKQAAVTVEGETVVIEPDPEVVSPEITVEKAEQLAYDGIKDYLSSKNPYEFQDFVAALLRAMGYFTPYVAPRGKDGGVDIVAYRDPLGTQTPRIKVQIKHRDSQTGVQDIRQLMGLLQKDGDVGMFVSSGGFSSDAKTTARSSHIHVELIDLERFIDLWTSFYPKLTDEDKQHLPLLPVYFLAPGE